MSRLSAEDGVANQLNARHHPRNPQPHPEAGFNTAFISTFVAPAVSCKKAEVFVAGNNGDAVATVAGLAKSAGFNPLVVGDITTSRVLERMGLAQTQQIAKANGKISGTNKSEIESLKSGPTIL